MPRKNIGPSPQNWNIGMAQRPAHEVMSQCGSATWQVRRRQRRRKCFLRLAIRAKCSLIRTLLLAMLMEGVAFAQAGAGIASVTNFDTGDTRLAPGSRALIRLTSQLDEATVQVNGTAAAVLVRGDNRLIVVLPMDTQPGTAMLTVTSRGIAGQPAPITVVPHVPVLATTRFWPGVYCPVLAPWGTTLVAYGLGRTDPLVAGSAVAPKSPLATTVAMPVVIVDGWWEAEVLSSHLVADRTNDGSYAVDFRLAPGTPQGDHSVFLRIGDQQSNTETLRVSGVVIKSAASAWEGDGAPGAIYSAYACAANLGTHEAVADAREAPSELAGTTVRVTDSAGVEHLAPLLYVSPRQVNFILPARASNGPGTVSFTAGDGTAVTTPIQIAAVAPAFFTESGYPVGWLVRVREGVQTVEHFFREVAGRRELAPIDLGPETDEVHLVLLGMGLRGRSSLGNVRVTIDGVDVPVDYAGPNAEFIGVDQLNLRLPRSLAGRFGEYVTTVVSVDGKFANGLQLAFH
jgi:uncharacterized protein (TIGR03437 family)